MEDQINAQKCARHPRARNRPFVIDNPRANNGDDTAEDHPALMGVRFKTAGKDGKQPAREDKHRDEKS